MLNLASNQVNINLFLEHQTCQKKKKTLEFDNVKSC